MDFYPPFTPFTPDRQAWRGVLLPLLPPFYLQASGVKVLQENKVFLIYLYIYTLLHPPVYPHPPAYARGPLFVYAKAPGGVKGVKGVKVLFDVRRPAA